MHVFQNFGSLDVPFQLLAVLAFSGRVRSTLTALGMGSTWARSAQERPDWERVVCGIQLLVIGALLQMARMPLSHCPLTAGVPCDTVCPFVPKSEQGLSRTLMADGRFALSCPCGVAIPFGAHVPWPFTINGMNP